MAVCGGRAVFHTAQYCLYARDKLLWLKRLNNIVIRAKLQSQNLVKNLAFRGEHDYRNIGFGSYFAANLPAILQRQHNIEQNNARVDFAEFFNCAFSVVHGAGGKAFLFDIKSDKLAYISFIVNDKNGIVCSCTHKNPPTPKFNIYMIPHLLKNSKYSPI